MDEAFDLDLDVLIQRFPVGENKNDIRQFLTCARLEETMQPIGKPADRECLAAAGGVIDKILSSDVSILAEMRQRILRDSPDGSALVITGEERKRWALRLIFFGLPLRYVNEEKGQRFEQTLFRQHFTIKELDRVLTF